MSTIRVGPASRGLEDVDAQWMTEQVLGRRKAGENPCVVLSIEREGINLLLRTGNCPSQAGAARQATPQERELLDRWRELGLEAAQYDVGQLVAFVNRLQRH